jgi:F-type H+-transporting ATPase subunit a
MSSTDNVPPSTTAADTTDTGEPTTDRQPPRPLVRRIGARTVIFAVLVLVVIVDAFAFIVFPPFPPGEPGAPCAFPICFINGTLEYPAPHVLVNFATNPTTASGGLAIIAEPSVTSTIFTLWIVSILLLAAIALSSRGGSGVPGRLQNFAEWAYEMMEDFATSIGGRESLPYVPIFVSFLILILVSNWAGLIPPVGRIELLRAPTSDVNVTIGLALVSFFMFEFEGFRKLGARRYLAKFFPLYEFRNGLSAGLMAMFVGITELALDFVRPLTLSMRLFGNIYGGEVALGVITALTLAVLPVLLLGLEFMLNLIQALIFSILSFMYIVLAIEEHGHDEGHLAEEALGSDIRSTRASQHDADVSHTRLTMHGSPSLGQPQSI